MWSIVVAGRRAQPANGQPRCQTSSQSSTSAMATPADFRCIGDADRCRSDPGRGHGAAACAYRKSNPDILVVQPAENWAAKNVPGPLDGARDRRILLQG